MTSQTFLTALPGADNLTGNVAVSGDGYLYLLFAAPLSIRSLSISPTLKIDRFNLCLHTVSLISI